MIRLKQSKEFAADLMVGSVRARDFVLRCGGEEMLVVLVEAGKMQALQVAETIRKKFAAEPLRVGDGQIYRQHRHRRL